VVGHTGVDHEVGHRLRGRLKEVAKGCTYQGGGCWAKLEAGVV
jgi:hypothetical protein